MSWVKKKVKENKNDLQKDHVNKGEGVEKKKQNKNEMEKCCVEWIIFKWDVFVLFIFNTL